MSKHHNRHRDILVKSFHCAHLSVQVEVVGSGHSADLSQSRPADILVMDWKLNRKKPATFNISAVLLLNKNLLSAVGASAGAASEAAELKKHTTNDTKCAELECGLHPSCGGIVRALGRVAQQFGIKPVQLHNFKPPLNFIQE